MTQRAPAAIGDRLADVDTPGARPGPRCVRAQPEDALRPREEQVRAAARQDAQVPGSGEGQIALGAVGMCCQKVSEAEAMVEGVASPTCSSRTRSGARKIERLAPARRAKIGVCVDHPIASASWARPARIWMFTSRLTSACDAAVYLPASRQFYSRKKYKSTPTCSSQVCRRITGARSTSAAWKSATA